MIGSKTRVTLIQILLNAIDLGLRAAFCTRASVHKSTLSPVHTPAAQKHCKALRMVYAPAKVTLVEPVDRSAMYDSSAGFVGLVYM